MEDLILNVNTLPEPLFRRIHSDKVKVHEADGVITLIPLDKEQTVESRLLGMFSDGKLSSIKYQAQKQLDKELES